MRIDTQIGDAHERWERAYVRQLAICSAISWLGLIAIWVALIYGKYN